MRNTSFNVAFIEALVHIYGSIEFFNQFIGFLGKSATPKFFIHR